MDVHAVFSQWEAPTTLNVNTSLREVPTLYESTKTFLCHFALSPLPSPLVAYWSNVPRSAVVEAFVAVQRDAPFRSVAHVSAENGAFAVPVAWNEAELAFAKEHPDRMGKLVVAISNSEQQQTKLNDVESMAPLTPPTSSQPASPGGDDSTEASPSGSSSHSSPPSILKRPGSNSPLPTTQNKNRRVAFDEHADDDSEAENSSQDNAAPRQRLKRACTTTTKWTKPSRKSKQPKQDLSATTTDQVQTTTTTSALPSPNRKSEPLPRTSKRKQSQPLTLSLAPLEPQTLSSTADLITHVTHGQVTLPKAPSKTAEVKKTDQSAVPHLLQPALLSDVLGHSHSNNNSAKQLPSGRWGHSMVVNGSDLIVFGGQGEHQKLENESIWLWQKGEWQILETTGSGPGRRMGHSAAIVDNKIVVFGGSKLKRWFSDILQLDLATNVWQTVPTSGKVPALAYHTMTVYNTNQLFVFGGVSDASCSDALYSLSLEDKNWFKLSLSGDIPSARSGHTATLVDDQLVVLGGWDAPELMPLNEVYILDLVTFEFTKRSTEGDCPSPRSWHVAVLMPNSTDILIYGGFNGDCALKDAFILSGVGTSRLRWTKVDAFKETTHGRAGHTAALVPLHNHKTKKTEDFLVMFGGGDNEERFFNATDLFHLT